MQNDRLQGYLKNRGADEHYQLGIPHRLSSPMTFEQIQIGDRSHVVGPLKTRVGERPRYSVTHFKYSEHEGRELRTVSTNDAL